MDAVSSRCEERSDVVSFHCYADLKATGDLIDSLSRYQRPVRRIPIPRQYAGFGTHPDNEEFLLIGDPGTKPLYLAVALCMRREFEEKVRTGRLEARDLVLLRCRYNDPEVSFFVIRRDLPLDILETRKYRLKVNRS